MPTTQSRWALAGLALAVAAGCGEQSGASATQVVAKVNGEELTIHQLNYALAATGNPASETAAEAKRAALEQLIAQHLVRQQAMARKLDRLPDVVQAMHAAQGEVLARAYLAQIAAAQPEPSAIEIRNFYAAHPQLFAERRLFDLHELVLAPEAKLAEALREQARARRSMAQIAAWLTSRELPFVESRGKRASEEIPMDFVREVHAMAVGEVRVVEGGGRVNVFRLEAREPAPVGEEAASARIRQLLVNQAVARAVANELELLRKQGHVEYLAELEGAATAKPIAAADPAQRSFHKAVRALR